MLRKTFILIILVFKLFETYAQNDVIEIDRLGKSNTPFTIPKKWAQFESGFLKQTDKDPQSNSIDKYFQHPLFLGRYGLSNRIEARLITEWVSEKRISTPIRVQYTGINTFQLGFKANFIKEKGIRPEIALIAHYSFNSLRTLTGKTDTIDGANFRFAFQHTLNKNLLLNYNVGMEWEIFRNEPTYIYTFSPRFKFEDNWCAFIEVFGYIWKKYKPEHSISAGLSYNINDNFRIDAAGGLKLNKRTPDNFYTLGCSFRFNTNNKNY